MEWIPCSGISKRATKNKKNNDNNNKNRVIVNQKPLDQTKTSPERLRNDYPLRVKGESKNGGSDSTTAQTFTFRELAIATKNFRAECLLGEGGFGRVYKGYLESTNQVVAIKQLNRNGLQGNREFLVEVLMLSLLHHPNLVNLIGYCADGDQRLLVYEYMPLGSLEDHLHEVPPGKNWLDWNTRMKIAAGAAKGLEHLHDKASPQLYTEI
ncbi:hypothetical protein H0E87_012692 [Populus deltoides]|uniref:non-specific serine/threonine protein kinase n=1 Tax=Populus deltoides TaxID=3696 RepID=A0A8T2YKH3_POPDE|nr:hypothetical protein H0E87_012692 [Populus deltoides]